MNDQISRQKLIEAIERKYRDIKTDEDVMWNRAIYTAVHIIKKQPPADQWIPCSERLPEVSGEYCTTIMWAGEPTLHRGFYNAERKRWSGQSYDPIAWKERPEPYKGAE